MQRLITVSRPATISRNGFTIVELLIIIVVIAILAAITIVSYNGISNRAKETSLRSETSTFARIIEVDKSFAGVYPVSSAAANNGKGLTSTGGNTITYTVDGTGTAFCLQMSRTGIQTYFATQSRLAPIAGSCVGVAGIAAVGGGTVIQTITNANCSATRTRAADARDGRTYWVQRLADGKCWMLTNLAYAGGGPNLYGDVKSLTNGTGGLVTYTTASYYVPTTANVTTEPTNPSTSTNGGATDPQYGYLYNWCGAMGGQTTAACANATTPTTTALSICPSGWRLPTGVSGGEYSALNTAVNGGLTNSDAGLRTTWLEQLSGSWGSGGQGVSASYWSSSPFSATSSYATYFDGTFVSPNDVGDKYYGYAVRCVAT